METMGKTVSGKDMNSTLSGVLILLAAGLILTGVALGVQSFRDRATSAAWPTTTAVVEGSVDGLVTYTYSVDGQTYEGQAAGERATGTEIAINYNPDNPARSTTREATIDMNALIATPILIAAGGVLLVISRRGLTTPM